jgi:hypothetical protein
MNRSELDVGEREKLTGNPRTTGVTILVTQVWGRKSP